MATITDYIHIPIGVRKIAVAAIVLLALYVVGEHLVTAFKTGVAQRLSSTPRYARSERPCMFWLRVIFFAVSAVLFAAALAAILWHWHDEKVF
jgi:hypothetical protein